MPNFILAELLQMEQMNKPVEIMAEMLDEQRTTNRLLGTLTERVEKLEY